MSEEKKPPKQWVLVEDISEDELRKLGIRGVHRQQIIRAFPNHSVAEINESLQRLAEIGVIYEPLPGVFQMNPLYGKDELHFLLDVFKGKK